MRARSRPDDRLAEAAQRRLEALVTELGGHQRIPPAEDEDTDGNPGGDPGGDPDGDPDGDPGGDLGTVSAEEPEPLGRHARRPLPGSQRAAAWAEDRLPGTFAGVSVRARHVAVLGVLLGLGLALAGWSYLRATQGPVDGEEVVAPRVSGGVQAGAAAPTADTDPVVGTPSRGPSSAAATTGAAAVDSSEVVVDVEGKVRRPGIAVLPAGSRVVDALEAAGGARPRADLRDLNLARVLVDGEQLLVGVDPPAGVAAGSLTGPSAAAGAPAAGAPATPVALVDLNTADQLALETLPGVGPVTAAAILEWRTQHGAFTSVDELLEVSGIGDATLAEIAPHVTL